MKTTVHRWKRRLFQYEIVLSAGSLLSFPALADSDEAAAEDDKPVPVLTQVVQEDNAHIVRRYPARVQPIEQVDVVSRLAADIEEIGFTEGATVFKGQLLYRLDDVRFVAAVSNQLAKIEELKAKLSLADANLGRKTSLLTKEMTSRSAYDEALAARNSLSAQVAAEKALLRLVEDDLAHTRIVSPIDGRIGLTAKTVGNYITPDSGTLTRIVRTDPLRIRFSLALSDYARLFAGDIARLKREAEISILPPCGLPPPPKAEVEFVDISAVKRTDTVLVYVRQPNPNGRLVPDAVVTLVMSVPANGRRPWVPPQAVIDDGDSTHVFVVEAGRAVLRQVEILAELPDRVFIGSGLKTGETVITGGHHKVSDGTSVSITSEVTP